MGLKKRLNEKEFYRDERTTKCRVITIRKSGEKGERRNTPTDDEVSPLATV